MEILDKIKQNTEDEIKTLNRHINIYNSYFNENSNFLYLNDEYDKIFFSMFSNKKIIEIKEMLHIKKNFLNYITKVIYKNCNHTWIYDSIDIDPDRSKTIIYCNKCFLDKK